MNAKKLWRAFSIPFTFMFIFINQVWASTEISPKDCEFSVQIPGTVRFMEIPTKAGLVRAATAKTILRGSKNTLFSKLNVNVFQK